MDAEHAAPPLLEQPARTPAAEALAAALGWDWRELPPGHTPTVEEAVAGVLEELRAAGWALQPLRVEAEAAAWHQLLDVAKRQHSLVLQQEEALPAALLLGIGTPAGRWRRQIVPWALLDDLPAWSALLDTLEANLGRDGRRSAKT